LNVMLSCHTFLLHGGCVGLSVCHLVRQLPAQIVDICLGATVEGKSMELHVEILKRLPPIVQFAVRYDRITDAQVELLWRAAQSKNDSIRRAMYDIIVETSSVLPLHTLDLLYSRIAALNTEDFDQVWCRNRPYLQLVFVSEEAARFPAMFHDFNTHCALWLSANV
jgi:hypothetical protein